MADTKPDLKDFDELESGLVKSGTIRRYVVLVLAVSWSLFQLSLPKLLTINANYSRCIHLAFAIALVFLLYPAQRKLITGSVGGDGQPLWKRIILFPFFLLRKLGEGYSWVLGQFSKIPGFDYILAGVAAFLALYYSINYLAISNNAGDPTKLFQIVGAILIVVLLEATRRCVGWALPIVAGSFILICFNAESLGDFAFQNATFSSVINKLVGTSGIYGTPLDVSTSTVFLFVLFGALLASAGGAQYFIQLAYSVVGVFTGGPAMAAVLASGLTGMVSGSSIANTVTTGTFTIPLMKRAGYSPVKAGAFEVAASTNGQIMPPVMGAAAFIMAEYCEVGYLEVVKAAVIPAVISYLALIYITYLEACKLNLGRISREEVPGFGKTFISGIYYFIPILVLLYILFIEKQSAQLAVFYSIICLVAVIFVREVIRALREGDSPLKGLGKATVGLIEPLESGARNMVSIGVAVAAAGIIGGVIGLGAGSMVTGVIEALSGGNIYILLIITALFCLILGMGLPTTANYIVIASLIVPAMQDQAEAVGLVLPVLAAHLFCFYFGILSDDTPPVGLSAYAASAISGADPIKTGLQGFGYDIRTAILPFLFVFNPALILHGVDNFWDGAIIFVAGLIAMLAFASLTQRWIRTRTNILESLGLAIAIFFLMIPNIFESKTQIAKPIWMISGVVIIVVIFSMNAMRKSKITPSIS